MSSKLNNNLSNKNKVLFTSYICSKEDDIVQKILQKWKQLNPDFDILYFSDKDVEIFFKTTKYYDTFKQMKNGVAIADFFRICYINKFGGIWFDIDLEPTKLKIENIKNVHLFDAYYGNISYMLIGGKPNQKLFFEVSETVNKNIINNLSKKNNSILSITGPQIIQNIICEKLKIKNEKGCLQGEKEAKIYLKNTDYEFSYQRIFFSPIQRKTLEYRKLQRKYKKGHWSSYDYI